MSTVLKNMLRQVTFAKSVSRKMRRSAAMNDFKKSYERFKRLSAGTRERFQLSWEDRYPCLDDTACETEFDRHYIYHTAWAARALAEIKPDSHVDVSSILYFSSIVSAFVPVTSCHFQPVNISLSGLTVRKADLLALPFGDNSVRSISCMHVVEHIGLGRYGDQLDPDGDCKAMAELRRVLAEGGHLLFVVPVGRPRIQFNAHRIYGYSQIMECFNKLTLRQFALIPDQGSQEGIIENATKELADRQTYGCGCFWFISS
jgi:SAM-dependent methyltransferase